MEKQNRPEAPQGPPPDTIMLCGYCRQHVLRLLQGRWWCYKDGDRPKEATLIYDRRR